MAQAEWFDQVGSRAGSVLDEPTKYGSKHEISSSMALGNDNKFEISKAQDLRVGEGIESWRAMRE